MHTPPPPHRQPNSPPQIERREPLQMALLSRDPNEVRSALHEDDTAAILPLRQRCGREPPLVVATRGRCSSQIVKMLVQAGAVVDDTGSSGLTPLMTIADTKLPTLHQKPSGVKASRDVHAGPILVPHAPWFDTSGEQTHVHLQPGVSKMSEEKEHCTQALWLLNVGADPDLLDKRGRTAAQIAQDTGQLQLSYLLGHWRNWEACRYLHDLWRRQDAKSDGGPCLACFPPDMRGLLCSMLAPWPPTDRKAMNDC